MVHVWENLWIGLGRVWLIFEPKTNETQKRPIIVTDGLSQLTRDPSRDWCHVSK